MFGFDRSPRAVAKVGADLCPSTRIMAFDRRGPHVGVRVRVGTRKDFWAKIWFQRGKFPSAGVKAGSSMWPQG